MSRFFLFHPKILLRGLLVLGAAALIGYLLLGPSLNWLADTLRRSFDAPFWRDLYALMSKNRAVILCAGCVLTFLCAADWIFRPAFTRLSGLVRGGIRTDGRDGEESAVRLPKSLKSLEDALNSVNTELRFARYAAKEAEQRKDELVVYLAHDIRTPLTSVLGYLELLGENRALPEAQRAKFLDAALRKAKRMQALVEELFEISRYSLTQLELEKSPVNLGMMLSQLAEELRPTLDERRIHLDMALGGAPPVFADPDKMARAFDNILHNAAYYTPPGGRVTVALEAEGTRTRVRVSNTGAEIPPEKLLRLFEKFYRGEESRQSRTGGSGLGLAIAKNIIEAHGGSITAESMAQITTFTVLI